MHSMNKHLKTTPRKMNRNNLAPPTTRRPFLNPHSSSNQKRKENRLNVYNPVCPPVSTSTEISAIDLTICDREYSVRMRFAIADHRFALKTKTSDPFALPCS